MLKIVNHNKMYGNLDRHRLMNIGKSNEDFNAIVFIDEENGLVERWKGGVPTVKVSSPVP